MRVSDWRRAADKDELSALSFMLLQWNVVKPNYDEWADAVEGAVSCAMSLMAQRKNDIQALHEDALTAQLTGYLECLGLEARSARVGGNCDVTVRYGTTYLWLGEAKIFTGVSPVWDGYLQLTTRYRTELTRHSRGGMLLYCYKEPAAPLLAEWRATLTEQVEGIQIRDGVIELSFRSNEPVEPGVAPYQVTHFAFPLFHEPKDRKIKLKATARKSGSDAKKAANSTRRSKTPPPQKKAVARAPKK